MDSPLQEVHMVRLDRKTRRISAGQVFPGPVWYSRRLYDGIYVACTVQETGPSHQDKRLHFMASDDLEHWEEAGRFEHDGLPKGLMKNGVAAFSDGAQTSGGFYMFFEAVKGLDGKSCLCRLTNI
jgi:hypothetical protein